MSGSMVDIQSPTAEIRRGKKERRKEERKKERRKKKPYGKNIMAGPIINITKVETRSCFVDL